MTEFFKKNKLMVLGGLLALFGAFAYFTFFSGGTEEILTASSDTESPVSRDLLVTLSNINTIQLDNSIFEDPVFLSLTNFGVDIPLQPVGRRNPFAPVGSN